MCEILAQCWWGAGCVNSDLTVVVMLASGRRRDQVLGDGWPIARLQLL